MKVVLLIEDHQEIRNAMEIYLSKQGFTIVAVGTGEEGLEVIKTQAIDLVLLDVMLPGMQGTEVMEEIRSISDIPVIMVTALEEESDKLKGFELGIDDYITKPFSFKELLARMRCVLTRLEKQHNIPTRDYKFIEIKSEERSIYLRGKELSLTRKEFDLLQLLIEHPKRVFSRDYLLDSIWGAKSINDDRTVDTHIKQIREKLGEDKKIIRTVWGVGYKFESEEA